MFSKFNTPQVILDFPKQFRAGLEAAKNIKIRDKFKGVVVCGMGGSALPGDILEMWLEAYQIGLPLFIHRNYGLPYQIDKDYLVICISYSGNTEETLTAFQQALRKKIPVVAIASGGRLTELCKKKKIPLAKMPSGIVPRLAIGYQFGSLMKILVNAGIIRNELKEVLVLEKILQPKKIKNQAQKLAKSLVNKIPLIYSSASRKNLAKIWKISFNENAKIMAFSNYFPELSHNEIEGFWQINKKLLEGKKIQVIILRDGADSPRILKQMEIIKDLIQKPGIKVEFIDLEGKDILEKIFSNIILALWTSYFLAEEYGIDPTQTKFLKEFKRKLAK